MIAARDKGSIGKSNRFDQNFKLRGMVLARIIPVDEAASPRQILSRSSEKQSMYV
jgi:hypothetical protein